MTDKNEELEKLKETIEKLTEDVSYWKNESRLSFESRDKAKAERRKLEKELEKSKLENKQPSKAQETQAKITANKAKVEKLRTARLQAQVETVAERCKAINANEIYRLLKDDFEFIDNGFKAKLGDDLVDLDTYVASFLARDESGHLVKSGRNPYGLHTRKSEIAPRRSKSQEFSPADVKRATEHGFSDVAEFLKLDQTRQRKLSGSPRVSEPTGAVQLRGESRV